MARSLLDRLRGAYADAARVVIVRDDLAEADELSGVVVAVGDEWLLLELWDDSVYFDGWAALRIADVTAVESEALEFERYVARARAELPAPPAIPLELLQAIAQTGVSAVTAMAASHPLVGIWTEEDDAEVLFIGRAENDGSADVTLREIDSAGVWQRDLTDFDAGEITRVTIGGRYQDALERFGESLPGL